LLPQKTHFKLYAKWKVCFSADVPVAFHGAAGGASLDGKPIVCGGWIKGGESESNACYKFDLRSNNWAESGRMTLSRSWSGFDHSTSWGLVIAGGWTVRTRTRGSVHNYVVSTLPMLSHEIDQFYSRQIVLSTTQNRPDPDKIDSDKIGVCTV
jgi:hypothetical protein